MRSCTGWILVTVLFIFPSTKGCATSERTRSEIVVSAAISLKAPMEEIVAAYHLLHQEYRIRLNFASSGLLSSQIERGAPADVYASASKRFMDELDRRGLLLPGSRRPLASNSLVLIVPEKSTLTLDDWSQLASLDRVAVGNPSTVPAGAYARECLDHLGLWDRLLERLVFGEHVRQVLDYAAQAEVDAAFVYSTDAAILPEAVRIAARAPQSSYSPIEYSVAVVAASQSQKEARALIEIATSSRGREIFVSHGFSEPEL